MNAPDRMRLQRVEVEGLFGIYNHRIDLNLEDRITLLHGPNGVGKTHTLGMINALLGRNTSYFRRVPCKRFRLTFADGALELEITSGDRADQRGRLTLHAQKTLEAEIVLGTAADEIAQRVDFLQRVRGSPDMWIDVRDGEVLTEKEVLSRFGWQSHENGETGMEDLHWLQQFLDRTGAYFIEDQRLVRRRPHRRARRFSLSDSLTTIPAVLELSRAFSDHLQTTMAQYGRKAQHLDQTFPQRLVEATDRLAGQDLRERMTALEKTTNRLEKLGLLGGISGQSSQPFKEKLAALDDTQARVMTLYVQDTEQKLEALADLADRVELILGNVNSKYRHKTLRVDHAEGFVAETYSGTKLSLDSLSSGEQHELVLHHDLLFRVPTNTIVLIDEPELSLHVAWQKRFLPDLLEIAKLSAFDAIVATHSPYIIGDYPDLMVGLGDPT